MLPSMTGIHLNWAYFLTRQRHLYPYYQNAKSGHLDVDTGIELLTVTVTTE